MANPKPRTTNTRITTTKRSRSTCSYTESSGSDSSCSDEGANDSQEEWEAVRILAQTGQGFGTKYLIEWAGIDPQTGKRWEPTWEKAVNAGEGLRASWKIEQQKQAQAKKEAERPAKRPRRTPRSQAANPQPARRRPVVESPAHSESESEPDLPEEAEHSGTASTTATKDSRAPTTDCVSSQVDSDPPSDSSYRNAYEPHSEIPESQPSPEKSAVESTELDSSDLFASQPAFRASGFVLETQSSAGDLSYIPVTQEELESSLHSVPDDDSEDHLIGYSGLLDTDVPPTLGVRAQSPATSVAETVADTTQDLHSQRSSESQQAQPKASDTLEPSSSSTEDFESPPPQNSASLDQQSESAIESHEEVESQLAFVENTTYVDREDRRYLRGEPQFLRGGTAECSVIVENQAATVDHTVNPASGSTESELLAVADTPQISQQTFSQRVSVTCEGRESPEQSLIHVQPSPEDEPDQSYLEENAQFPFHSQYPVSFGPRSAAGPARQALTETPESLNRHRDENTRSSEGPHPYINNASQAINESEESTTIDEVSQPLGQLTGLHSSQSFHSCDNVPTPEPNNTVEQALGREDSQPSSSPAQSSGSREHHAQFIPSSALIGIQEEDRAEDIRASIENSTQTSNPRQKRSFSRHDSSQETPERQIDSAERVSSPIPHPPSYSLRACDSTIPPRPVTPTLTPASSKMAGSTSESASDYALRRLREEQKAALAVPYVRPKRNTVSVEGTRSPSTVPDKPPVPPVQTSLRSVAFANAQEKAVEPVLENPLAATSTDADAGPSNEMAEHVAAVVNAVPHSVPEASPEAQAADDIEEMDDVESDYDIDDNESMYDDGLNLAQAEYIVPLFIEGRQKDTYIQHLARKPALLDAVVRGGNDLAVEKVDEAEQILNHLKSIETHPDLTYAEAESATGLDLHSAADVQHGAQFGIDNSVKFKFLGELFDALREHELHIVLLLHQDNTALMNILQTFLNAGAYRYKMPTMGAGSDSSNDSLKVTVFSSTASPIISAVDLIICLDGVQDAAQIRQKTWAAATGQTTPVLHLVIPRTVGHLERYVRSDFTRKKRIVSVLIGLSHFKERGEIGERVHMDTPSPAQSARVVASWLAPEEDHEHAEWPLPSIGSMRDLLELEGTQESALSAASSPVPERVKRPLETDDHDTAKRARYTPQPPTNLLPSTVPEPEVTRISDSMPSTSASIITRLEAALAHKEAELIQLRKEHREQHIMWDQQQTQHEARSQQVRTLAHEKTELALALETTTHSRDKLRAQLDAKTTEARTTRADLDAQRALTLSLPDAEKDTLITRLHIDLEAATLARDKALAAQASSESTLEYTKEQYRIATSAAASLQSRVSALEAETARLATAASGEAAKLATLNKDASAKIIIRQNQVLQSELAFCKTALKAKEDELYRLKNSAAGGVGARAAYGTRAMSTTPQPKTRSRAASPERGGRAQRGGGGRVTSLIAGER